jgi:hypothetical protein
LLGGASKPCLSEPDHSPPRRNRRPALKFAVSAGYPTTSL